MNKDECPHDGEVYERYFMKNKIERKGQYCKDCHKLLDYTPQYMED
jgi:nitrate/TMAO reductase-like tetraheme cytochrome c subunit